MSVFMSVLDGSYGNQVLPVQIICRKFHFIDNFPDCVTIKENILKLDP